MPRLASLGLAFVVGVVVASRDGASGAGVALAWAALAIGVAATWPRGAAWLLIAALAGAARMSVHELPRAIVLPSGVAADDRGDDSVRGRVSGPVEVVRGQQRFVVEAEPGHARIDVSAPELPAVRPGDGVVVTGRLRTPRGYRVPGAVDWARVAAWRGVDLGLHAWAVDVALPNAAWSPWRAANDWQQRSARWIAGRGGDAAVNAVVRAMVLGDRSGLDHAVTERYRRTGTAHVLSVSGLHLAVAALLVFAVVRRVWPLVPVLGARIEAAAAAALVAAPFALAYTLMTGGRVPTVRALVVVLVMLGGALLARRAALTDALGLAALVVLVHRPSTIFDPSFQLSFAATATLALAVRPATPALMPLSAPARVWRQAVRLIHASLWTMLGTAPFTALAFGSVAVAGVLGNVVAVPVTELVIVPIGLASCVLSSIWPAAAGVLLDVTLAAAGWMDRVIAWIAEHAPVVAVYPPNDWELGGAFAIWAGALYGVRGARRRVVVAMVLAGVVVVALSYALTTRWLPAMRDEVRVTFLDAGQGDAAVIELPGGGAWLVDGGGLPFVAEDGLSEAEREERLEAPGRDSVARFLAWRRIGHLDRVIISHPHPDHYEGLRAVAREVSIGEVWVARGGAEPPPFRALLGELGARGTRIVHPRLDVPYERAGVRVLVLAPRYDDDVATADPVSGINDNSLVVRIEAYGRAVVFAGDIEREGEELLLERHQALLRADVVKVPHHGSRTSSSWPFVRATSPSWAVISCGVANRFGFPAPEVVARWQAAGAAVVRTDRAGAVTVTVAPGGALSVDTFVADGE